MKIIRCFLLVLLLSLGVAQVLQAGSPPPSVDRIDHDFSAVCQVSIGIFGSRTAVMTKSTGFKALDDYITTFAGEFYSASAGDKFDVRVGCGVVKLQTPQGESEVTVAMPHPPYPDQGRPTREQGSAKVKASFGKDGRVIGLALTQSSGNKLLDANTIDYVRKRWRSPGGKKVTIAAVLTYRLR